MARVERIAVAVVLLALPGCGGSDRNPPPVTRVGGATERAAVAAPELAAPHATVSSSARAVASGPSTAPGSKPPEDLDACILEVLQNPFPGQAMAMGPYYGDAVTAFSQRRDDDAVKLFSEAYLFTGTAIFVPLAHFGHGEIERHLREPVHQHFALGRYELILAVKTPHPVRELTLLRKAQGLAATGKPEAALATLAELDAGATLGRCDASIRPAMATLLSAIVGANAKLDAKACGDARTSAQRLGVESVRTAVAARCPP